jgi:TonB-linked SusC/RagA family outer membrane protein
LKSIFAGDFSNGFYDNFTEENLLGRSPTDETYNKNFGIYQYYTSTTTATYQKLFANKHDFSIMVGYEVKKGLGSNLSSLATDFPVQVSQSFNLSTNPNKTANGTLSDYGQYLSQFSRLNYVFDNRFLFSANIRRDGSPKFGPEHRYGIFPSVAFGWKMQNERFFKNLNLNSINVFKPRISWGILGNESTLGNYLYQPVYSPVISNSMDGQTAVRGYNNVKIVNKDIKWEEIKTFDVGLDLEMFKNRLSFTADYYDRETSNMIYYLPVPQSSGIIPFNYWDTPSMPINIGKISNKGYEIAISFKDSKGNFRYNIGGNISHNSNQMVDLGVKSAIYAGSASVLFSGTSPFKTINGQPIGQIYGYKVDGIIQNQAEVDALNANAATINGEGTYYNNPLTSPGDLKFRDIDGNGTITEGDLTYIGNPWPKLQYGFNIDMGWKGFDLSAQIVGIAGRDVLNIVKSFEQSFKQDFQSTYQIFGASNYLGNGITDQPRFGTTDAHGNYITDPNGNYRLYSSYLVEDGSYLKVKNITIGYSIPASVLSKIKIDQFRIFLTAQNLLTLTKFSGLDPEFSNDPMNYGLYDINYYPQTRLYSAGIEIRF